MTKTPPASVSNIIVFAYSYPPVNSSGADRPARFVKYLKREGFASDVITAPSDRPSPDSSSHHVPDALSGSIEKLRSRLADLYQSAVSPYHERLPWAVFAAERAVRLIHQKEIKALISTTPPIGAHAAALKTRQRFNLPWIADFRDPIVGNPFRTAKRAQAFYRRIERSIAVYADHIVLNTESFATTMKQRYPDCAGKISVIPNGYDPEDSFGPLPVPPESRKVIAHVGTLYGGRHPGLLLASLQRLIDRAAVDPSTIRLDFIGQTDTLDVPIESFPRLIGLGCIQCTNLLPRAEARRRTAQANGLLLLDLNTENTSLQVPAKVYDYILVGRPILIFTSRNSPTAAIMATSGVPHVVVDPSDSGDAIDEAVQRYLSMPDTPVSPSPEFRHNHDGALQTARLADLLRNIIAKH